MAEKGTYQQPTTTQQPMAVPQMAVGGNRNVNNLPVDANGKRAWSFGLLSCCGDCGACCCSCWCPCLLHARNRRRLDHLNTQGYPDPRRDDYVVADGVLYAFVQICFDAGWIIQIGTRQNIRERYGIQGNGCGDACAAGCCTGCDLVQGHRELKLEEDSFQQMQ